jgi:hypothetical protein
VVEAIEVYIEAYIPILVRLAVAGEYIALSIAVYIPILVRLAVEAVYMSVREQVSFKEEYARDRSKKSSKIAIYLTRKPAMTPENQKKLREHARGITEILYQEAAPENLESLADIEKTIRQQTLEYITPQLGVFFSKK